jgi:hypothetical protein
MQRSLRRAALAAAILSAAFGCTKAVVQQNKTPPDPLLISKKPVEGKPTSATGGRDLARIDPQPPVMPAEDGTGFGAPVRLSSELVVHPDQ